MSNTDAVHVLLAGRAGVYRLLQNILGNEPCKEMLEELYSGSVREVFRLFIAEQADFEEAVAALRAKAGEYRAGGDDALDKLNSAFTRLFVGPNVPEASPWESSYLSGDKTLFNKITLEVRNAYRTQGLLPAGYPHIADDHVALELDYLARLAERAEVSWAAGDKAAALNSLVASREFLQEHLLRWATPFASAVSASTYAGFYREAAGVLVFFLSIDRDALEELEDAIAP